VHRISRALLLGWACRVTRRQSFDLVGCGEH
jgi:hypothetical protein